jgi:ABC-type transport system involved in cytochrome c biogenesis permease subunit
MSTTTADPTATAPGREPSRKAAVHPVAAVLRPLASLQLTVVLFALAVGLVFLGTLAQKGVGIWTVVEQYFWSWVVMVDTQHLLEFGKIFFGLPPDLNAASWAKFPFPGGKLIGGLMFVNLLAAHILRFRLTWKRAGIFILHAGVLLLFVGEFITREFQVEQQMHITEGSSTNFAVDTRNYELAFVDPSDAAADRVTVIPAKRLAAARNGERIAHPDLPVDVEVLRYMPNSDLVEPADPRAGENPATAGVGTAHVAVAEPEVSGVEVGNRMDLPSAYVRLLKKGTDEPVGTYLVSLIVGRPQKLAVDGKGYELQLRNTRYYKPFTLHLIEFRFDRYVGTNTPKNYSSQLRLVDPEKGQDREVLIKMNDPLRHRGETFYQSSFTPDEKTTILQVVRNPGWMLPYISCAMVVIGMLLHFGIGLYGFILRLSGPSKAVAGLTLLNAILIPLGAFVIVFSGRRSPAAATGPGEKRPLIEWLIPVIAVVMAVLYVAAAAAPKSAEGKFDLREVARLPVVDGGRVKPLDTLVRVDLRRISHTEEYTDANGKTQPAIKWFLTAASDDPDARSAAADLKIFRIEHDQVRDLLKLPLREGFRYSIKEMRPRYAAFLEAVEKADDRPPKLRDLYEVKLLELSQNIQVYLGVAHGRAPMLLPPGDGREWRAPADVADVFALRKLNATVGPNAPLFKSVEQLRARFAMVQDPQQRANLNQQLDELVLEARAEARDHDPALAAWDGVLDAYRAGEPGRFNSAVAAFRKEAVKGVSESDMTRVRFEAFLNESGLFYQCTVMYGLAALMCVAGWLGLMAGPSVGDSIRRAAFWWLVVTFLAHTFTLLSRMYLMDRPLVFVTNLYSSAVFIGWAVTAVCLVVERLYPIGVGNLVAAVLGFSTSIIAHNLAASGDTLEMMQAVLDTNFWLATHVTTVTLGYAATFVAATVALVYVALWVAPPNAVMKKMVTIGRGPAARPTEVGRVLGQILYGVVCFATLLSFTGTVLGGIWADQSWGRFWGWDPKENGAVLVVLWNALILHARWCGLVKDRGIAVLALVGAMIATWSWFGTNQLGVGLHAYGFSNKLALGCERTWVALSVMVVVGLIPWPAIWKSKTAPTPGPARR